MHGYVDNIISCKKTLQFILYFKIEINACMHHHHHKHTHTHISVTIIIFYSSGDQQKLLYNSENYYGGFYLRIHTHSVRETHVRPRNNMLEMSKDGFMMTNK